MEGSINKNLVLFIASLPSFLVPFMMSSLNIALPSIGQEFSLNAIQIGWIATSYILTSAVFLLPFGKIADIYGRKKIFTLGVLVFTTSSFLCALSRSASVLILFRIMQGIGASMIFSNGVAILTSVFPPRERGKALGINIASVYIGLSLGPTLGGVLTHSLGWRSIFLLNVPMGLLVIFLSVIKLKSEWTGAKGEKFDYFGSGIYSLMLVFLMYGLSKLPAISGSISIGIGTLGLFGFLLWERRTRNPVLNVNLFKDNKPFALSNLAALVNYSATSATAFILSLYLQYIKGLGPREAGLVLLSQPIMQAIFSPITGRLSDRIEPRILASTGMILCVLGLSMLTFLTIETSLSFVIASLMFLGLGFALFSSPNTNAVMSSVNRQFYGVASGILSTMRMIGQMLSMGIIMLIFSMYIGNVKITPEYHLTFVLASKIAFTIFAVMCFGGIFASLARGKVHLST